MALSGVYWPAKSLIQGVVSMRLFAVILIIFCSISVRADPFGTAEKVSMSMSLDSSLNPWERQFNRGRWEAILENCYDRNINSNARMALVDLLESNSGQFPDNFSESDIDSQLAAYCSRVLSLANELGLDMEVRPISTDKQTLNVASLISDCYNFRSEGFSEELKAYVSMAIGAAREIDSDNSNTDVNAFQILLGKLSLCGSAFAKSLSTPILLKFSQR